MALPVLVCLYRDAKAIYSCKAEHSHELSFPQGATFSNGEQRQQKKETLSCLFQFGLKSLQLQQS